MTDSMLAQVMVNRIVNELKKRDIPGVSNIATKLGEEADTLLVTLAKRSIKHGRNMQMEYPFSHTELLRKEPAEHAADIARMIGKADEIGPPMDADARLAMAAARMN